MAVRYSKRTSPTIRGKKIGTDWQSSSQKVFFLHQSPLLPQNYLRSDGPSALFLLKERLIAGFLKQERIKRASLASKEEHYVINHTTGCPSEQLTSSSNKAWFSFAAELPATLPPVLPTMPFRHENRSRR